MNLALRKDSAGYIEYYERPLFNTLIVSVILQGYCQMFFTKDNTNKKRSHLVMTPFGF